MRPGLNDGTGLDNGTGLDGGTGYNLADELGLDAQGVDDIKALPYRAGVFEQLARPDGGSPFWRYSEGSTPLLYQTMGGTQAADDVRWLQSKGELL